MSEEERHPQFIGGPLDGQPIGDEVRPDTKELWLSRPDILDDDGNEQTFFYGRLEDGNFHFIG